MTLMDTCVNTIVKCQQFFFFYIKPTQTVIFIPESKLKKIL